jgi:D-alanyl-D-alanine carboxypeptidase
MFQGRLVRGHNHVLERYAGTDGIKTGYIANAGFNLVTSTRRGDKRLVGVVLGSTSPPARDAYMIRMLESNFSKAKDGNTIAALPGTSAGAVNPIAVAQAPQADAPISKTSTKALALVAQKASTQEAAPASKPQQDDMAALVTATAKPPTPLATDSVQASAKPKTLPFAVVATNDQPSALADAQADDSWTIQVGAFPDKDRADEKLAVLRGKLPELLSDKQSFTMQAEKNGKPIYRARFAGFDAVTAKKLCSKLSREGTKCLAIAPQS